MEEVPAGWSRALGPPSNPDTVREGQHSKRCIEHPEQSSTADNQNRKLRVVRLHGDQRP